MELDELKYLWQTALDPEEEEETLSPEEIQGLIKGRSLSALGKVNRNIWIESVLVILLGIVWAWFVFSEPDPSPVDIWTLAFFVLGSLVFYFFKYRSLNRKTLQSGNLRESLTYTVRSLGQFMNIYYYVFLPFIPLVSGAGILYGFKEGAQANGDSMATIPLKVWGILFVVMAIYMVLGYFAMKWYVHRLYGQHYQELSACLDELMENEMTASDL
ncbi:MAG: hypothetical protein AAFV07_05015 [Bacteroidota bacterium]